ncbi:MAG: DUF4334 domain-containing protein [Moraxellaceae bacterium]
MPNLAHPAQQLHAFVSSGTDTETAFALFDQLEPVYLEEMLGQWHGGGLPTGHVMDGMLEAFGWYGKTFTDPNHVHPLLFTLNGQLVAIDPKWLPIAQVSNRRLPAQGLLAKLSLPAKFALKTGQSRAQIRMMDYRGKVSAVMIYDHLPIMDIFRKVDGNTLLGVMDLKGMQQPFFFVLYRD